MSDQNNRIKISITGDLGSGKSTVCQYLKDTAGLAFYSTGQIQRTLALKYKLDILAFNKYMETHPEIDEEIDAELVKIGRKDEDMVLDSRMAWHFVPDSFKIFLSVDIDEAVRRIMKDQRGSVESYANPDEAKNKLLERKQSENQRYTAFYGVDCSDPKNFDLIIDTTNLTVEETGDIILSKIHSC